MIEFRVKCFGDAWRRKECHPCIFKLLRICTREVGRVLLRQKGSLRTYIIGMGLHQCSALSPFIFTLAMDELTRGTQDALPWCMLFVNDIFLIDETRQGVNDNLERWRRMLEVRGFRVSRSKPEYLHCYFSGRMEAGGEITVNGRSIPKVDKFKYLGLIIQQNWEIDEDVNQ